MCPEGGMSREHSPLSILTDERLDCDHHFKMPFGTAIEACNQGARHDQLPERTIAGVHVGPAMNFQDGHEPHDIETRATITRVKRLIERNVEEVC